MSRTPKLSAEQKRTARLLVGKTIKSIALCPFDPEQYSTSAEPATDPVILFTDGTSLRFLVEETEAGEYGVALIHPAQPYREKPSTVPAGSPLGRPPTKHPRDHRP